MIWSPLRGLIRFWEYKKVMERLKARYEEVNIAFQKVNCHKSVDYRLKEEEITGKGNTWKIFEVI